MGFEIERKFLTCGEGWRGQGQGVGAERGVFYTQGYISTDPEHTVRVRIAGDEAFLTVKSGAPVSTPFTRFEFEYAIPMEDAHQMLDAICGVRLITKRRYKVPFDNRIWEIDEFLGANAGLIVAEIELENENAPFTRPPWVGEEVSLDLRYSNAALSKKPFSTW